MLSAPMELRGKYGEENSRLYKQETMLIYTHKEKGKQKGNLMKENKLIKQLRNNVDNVVGGYLWSQVDYGEEEYPNLTEQEWFEFCTSEIYDMKNNGSGFTMYAKGICDNLKFLGNETIRKVIIEIADSEGLVKEA